VAAFTVSELMSQIGSTVNQDPTAPLSGSTDYNLWISFMERAQREWQEAHDWEDTRKDFFPNITQVTAASLVVLTIPLPSDFYRVAGPPVNWSLNNIQGVPWPEVLPDQRQLYSVYDKYFYVLGNMQNGFNMIWNPGSLLSGASVQIPYFSVVASLASSGQVLVMRDPSFVVDRTVAYILESRYDPRFQEIEVKARERLLNMVANHDAIKYASYSNKNYVLNQTRLSGFRWGRD